MVQGSHVQSINEAGWLHLQDMFRSHPLLPIPTAPDWSKLPLSCLTPFLPWLPSASSHHGGTRTLSINMVAPVPTLFKMVQSFMANNTFMSASSLLSQVHCSQLCPVQC